MSPPSAAYLRLESLHVRQGLQRAVPLVGALALNGAGWLAVPAVPRHPDVCSALGVSAGADGAAVLAGSLLVPAAAALRVFAKGVLVRKRTVTVGGVYGRVRHPYYLANLAGCVGILLLAGVPGAVAALAWLAVAVPVFLVTIRGEEMGLRGLHGPAWDGYAARVPRLLPALGPAPPPPTGGEPVGVTWCNLVAEREPPRLARFLAGAAGVASCRFEGAAAWTIGGIAAALFLASHAIPSAKEEER